MRDQQQTLQTLFGFLAHWEAQLSLAFHPKFSIGPTPAGYQRNRAQYRRNAAGHRRARIEAELGPSLLLIRNRSDGVERSHGIAGQDPEDSRSGVNL